MVYYGIEWYIVVYYGILYLEWEAPLCSEAVIQQNLETAAEWPWTGFASPSAEVCRGVKAKAAAGPGLQSSFHLNTMRLVT